MKIGELLRHKRKEMGLSLGQVSRELFIQERYLQAIEEGNYEIIPGEVFLRAYFWQYAEFLGVKDYVESIAKPTRLEPEEKEPPMNDIFGGEWDTPRRTRVGLKLGLPILIVVLIVMGVRAARNKPAQAQEPERVSGTQVLEVVPTDTAEPSWQIPTDRSGEGTANQVDEMTHRITLRAIGQCWVTLETRDGIRYEGTMVAGNVLNFTDLIGFHLVAGKPEKLEVEFDGELMPWEQGQTEMILPEGASVFPGEGTDSEPGN